MSKRLLLGALFGALAIAARLPFLITGKVPFDSDEAVEGLMARHVLNGELPAFFWGQAFKGVPEVYLSAGAFGVFGSSVATLKSVTLVLFGIYVALNFVLLDRISSRWVAAASSVLLIAAPPALVFWSLDASAEYIILMLLGTLLLLVVEWRTAGELRDRTSLLAAGLVIGAGLWVHQLFVIYLVPLGVILLQRSGSWKRRPIGRVNAASRVLAAIALLYLSLGVVAFFSGGFSLEIGSAVISATAPQKMLRIAAVAAALALAVGLATAVTRETARGAWLRYWPIAAGFVTGYMPVILYSVLVEPSRSPARNANLVQLLHAAPDILGNIVPIVAGFKIATTERLAIPFFAAIPAAAALAAYLWTARHRLARDFFPLFVVFVPLLFLVSGAYLDTQSYRYFIPWYAGLSVAWAAGSLALAGGRKAVATAIVAAIVAVHGWQQLLWYQKLQPDTHSAALIECMRQRGARGGFADYWTAYKLTFLAREEIIVAPSNGVDRYPPYTEFVRSLPESEQINVESAACP